MIFFRCQVRAEYNDFRLAAHLGRDGDGGSGGGEGQDHQGGEGGEVKSLGHARQHLGQGEGGSTSQHLEEGGQHIVGEGG